MHKYNFTISSFFFGASVLLCTHCIAQQMDNLTHYKFSAEIEAEFAKQTAPYRYQAAAWDYSYIGNYLETLKKWDEGRTSTKTISFEELNTFKQNYHPTSAEDYIVEKAKVHQIVIINEAHHQPSHRYFTKSLLIHLYKQGYRLIGFETLNDSDPLLNKRKYPTISSGTYSTEPQYGDLIRMSLELGFKVFPYEASGSESGKNREIEQANNIVKVREQNPETKMIIHCGFAHAFEDEYQSWGKAMAGRLKEFTGIDPLTIDQTNFSERSAKDFENPLYKELDLERSSVYLDSVGNSYKLKSLGNGYDIMVFHPRTMVIDGRPMWIWSNRLHNKVKLSLSKIKKDLTSLIFAFRDGENLKEAIPCDIIEYKGQKKVFLSLRKGKYNIYVKDEKNDFYKIKTVVVE